MTDALRFHVRPKLRNPSLLLAFDGWSDAGEAATTAARYVEKQLHAVPLAEIDCEDFFDFTVRRPEISVEEGVIQDLVWPDYTFSYASIGAETDLVIGIGGEPHLQWRRFADNVVTLVRKLAIERVALLGGFLADVLYSRPVRVTCVAGSPERIDKVGLEPVRYQGPTGISGVLGHALREAGCEVAGFWAGLPHYIRVSPNPRGSLALLEALRPYIGLRLDMAPLQSAAAECEERVSAMVSADPELTEYVKQLKRREFAQ